jgi:hypothetical protein
MSLMTHLAGGDGEDIELGSEEHKNLFCRMLLDSHDPYRAEAIPWPELDDQTRGRIISLPIWDIAVATEGRAGMNVSGYGATVSDPLLREAIALDAFEEARHKRVLARLVDAYRIELGPEPAYPPPRDPEFAFMRTGYSECIDSVFGFGLFAIARRSGFFPAALIAAFEPVMREEGRHILFFVNWVAWWRRTMPRWRRPWFELKEIAVWLVLILERISLARGMGKDARAQDHNFTLHGSQELGVEVSFAELAEICLTENDRRLRGYDRRLVRPRLVPTLLQLALRLLGRGKGDR